MATPTTCEMVRRFIAGEDVPAGLTEDDMLSHIDGCTECQDSLEKLCQEDMPSTSIPLPKPKPGSPIEKEFQAIRRDMPEVPEVFALVLAEAAAREIEPSYTKIGNALRELYKQVARGWWLSVPAAAALTLFMIHLLPRSHIQGTSNSMRGGHETHHSLNLTRGSHKKVSELQKEQAGSVKLEVRVETTGFGNRLPLRPDGVLHSEDRYDVFVRIDHYAWIYVVKFATDDTPIVLPLQVTARNEVRIPQSSNEMQSDSYAGEVNIYVIASLRPLDEINRSLAGIVKDIHVSVNAAKFMELASGISRSIHRNGETLETNLNENGIGIIRFSFEYIP